MTQKQPQQYHPVTGVPLITDWICRICLNKNTPGKYCDRCGRKGFDPASRYPDTLEDR